LMKDLNADVAAWYFRSTPVWIGVMALASAIFFFHVAKLRREGVDVEAMFARLPPE
ncbi:MAG: amino acid transporter, partial [Gemmatimonadetes bacterium]|nr:amino acid transporter [Gemmatimonadota bacterium]